MESEALQQIKRMCLSSNPKVRKMALGLLDPDRTPESMLRHWHEGMSAPVRDIPTEIPTCDVERRLRLNLEEYLETVKAAGFTIVSKTSGKDIIDDLRLVPVTGVPQDLIEVSDGLTDQLVVTLGHAVEAGLPITELLDEVMWSNGTKLPIDGVPYLNICTTHGEDCDATLEDCILRDPTAPRNKILKPESYVKADIKGVLEGRYGKDTNQHKLAFE